LDKYATRETVNPASLGGPPCGEDGCECGRGGCGGGGYGDVRLINGETVTGTAELGGIPRTEKIAVAVRRGH
jgi:hypothetical protein